jgi:hypothetical protein
MEINNHEGDLLRKEIKRLEGWNAWMVGKYHAADAARAIQPEQARWIAEELFEKWGWDMDSKCPSFDEFVAAMSGRSVLSRSEIDKILEDSK